MKVGESRTLVIPSALGYGSSGSGAIPGGATLIFTTTLLNIVSINGVVNGKDVYIPNGESTPSTTNGTNFGMIGANDTAITETFLINSDGFLNDILSATNPISLSGAGTRRSRCHR